MKRLSSPQLVILLDVLFIFLFILILKETPPKTKIVLPKTMLEIGGFLSLEYENNKRVFYDPMFQIWSSHEKNNYKLYTSIGKFAIEKDCDSDCLRVIKDRYNLGEYSQYKNIKIVITNELLDNIARITYLACQTDVKNCGNIIFTINKKWMIDRKKLLNDNQFLKGIPGLVNNF